MSEEVTTFLNRHVYTNRGQYVGVVANVVLDVASRKVASMLVTNTNPNLVEGSRDVAVPFRWVTASGDIVILGFFPEKVAYKAPEPEPEPEIVA